MTIREVANDDDVSDRNLSLRKIDADKRSFRESLKTTSNDGC